MNEVIFALRRIASKAIFGLLIEEMHVGNL